MAEAPWRAQGPTGPPGVGRHKSDVSDRRVEPPLCVQNAMLTKDKKPFTYTPGGIDLSEIRSPRMARRIERNANSPGVAEVVITSPYQGSAGPLPPSALAAMQSAMPVQVFPSGPPPPPPPPSAPVPPPPPMGPLPTITVATNEGVFERPDMTKIIPENPMALLRKTSGVNRRSFVDETDYSQGRPQNVEYDVAPRPQFAQAQSQMQPRPPQTTQFPSQAKPQPQMVSQPQHLPNSAPNQNSQAEVKTSTAQLGSLYIPPLGSNGTQASSSPPAPPQRKVQSPDSSPDSPQSPIPVLNKAPRPWQNQKPAQQELPPWAQRSQSPPRQQSPPAQTQQQLPSPPIQQQQQQQRQVPSSLAPQQQQQQRQIPTSPVYQQQQQQQRQVPTSPVQQQPRLNQQIRPPQQQQQPTIVGRVIIPVQMDASPSQNSNKGVDAVFVTQPVVLQHPGARPEGKQQQSQQQQQRPVQPQAKQQQQVPTEKGIRIIPIQIEGGGASNSNVQRQDSKLSGPGTAPATPGSARTFNRQPSWSSTPTQSNSFKVIQKITNTDGEEDEDQVTIEHSPKSSQHFNQGQADQARKLKLSEGDRELMNKFKQGVDEENSVHKEVDPRYRGAAIPSRAFRYLQSMTDGSDDQPAVPPASVPRSPQGGGIGANRGPQVRTIPVQIEGESSGKPYVPPSEQTVQEPKKYTGSAIPSRSFKMLQAMTGDKCAAVNRPNEPNESQCCDPSHFRGYSPAFLPHSPAPAPPLPPPYWQYYYSPCPTPTGDDSLRTDSDVLNKRGTPVAFAPPKPNFGARCKDYSESESEGEGGAKCTTRRSTPLPFWGYYPQAQYTKQAKDSVDTDSESDQAFTYATPTPLPVWGCYSPFYPISYSSNETDSEAERSKKTGSNRTTSSASSDQDWVGTEKTKTHEENQTSYPAYPHFWNPLTYYPYFYGYPPPVYPYPPFYPSMQSDTEEYSSTDEMAYYNSKFRQHKDASRHSTLQTQGGDQAKAQKTTASVTTDVESDTCEEDTSSSDADETEVDEEVDEEGAQTNTNPCGLQAIRSVSDIKIYDVDDSRCTDEEDNASEGTTTEENDDVSVYTEEEVIPHQLSVIYEESERSDASRMDRHVRECSVATTVSVETVTMGNDYDPLDFDNLNYPLITEPDDEERCEEIVGDRGRKSSLSVGAKATLTTTLNKSLARANALYSSVHHDDDDGEETVKVSSSQIERLNDVEKAEMDESRHDGGFKGTTEDGSDEVNAIEETKSVGSSGDEKDWWSVIGDNDANYPTKTNTFQETTVSATKEEPKDAVVAEDGENPSIVTEEDGSDIDFWQLIESTETATGDKSRHETQNLKDVADVKVTMPEEEEEKEENDSEEIEAEKLVEVEVDAQCLKTMIDIEETRLEETGGEVDVQPLKTVADVEGIGVEGECKSLRITAEAVGSEREETDDARSTSSTDSSSVCSGASEASDKAALAEEPTREESSGGSTVTDSECSAVRMPSIKDRIKALEEAAGRHRCNEEARKTARKEEAKTCKVEDAQGTDKSKARERLSVIEDVRCAIEEATGTKSLSTKSSVRSFEDVSEDEVDSGVTSDVSRHISDNESDFPELKKMTRYQRAATHSRLFKLLQDECEQEEGGEEEEQEAVTVAVEETARAASTARRNALLKEQEKREKLNEEMLIRRGSLSLPLNDKRHSESDSFSSSGVNSPGSPVINDRLVNELVQSLLRRKKGHIFRNMSMEKLHSAAFRILQEDIETSDISYDDYNSFLSPSRNCTVDSSPAHTPQEFYTNYSEYTQYYDSWSEAERLYQASYDILPSKAFKLIQEQAVMNKTGSISGFLARCPRVLSAKNLMGALEGRESPPTPRPSPILNTNPNSEASLESKGAASAS